ncbi:MAG: TetR/AcrR family transcriptional regulator [Pseudomonadota bacterium]
MMRKQPEQSRSKNRVTEIMNATKVLIVERGIDGFTMKDIADQAEMKPTALYRYFPNKPAVLQELTLQMFQDDNAMITQRMVDSDASPETVMREGTYEYWRLHQEEPYRVKLNLAIQTDPELWNLSLEASKESVKAICEALVEKSGKKNNETIERRALLNVILMTSVVNFVSFLDDAEAGKVMEEFVEMTVNNMLKEES